ncbi:alternate signal-mediated exported protein [Rhodoglobus vestalii]|uniref:Alternate signal-mediated exported protein n=1 Tax=Rhodoglobus vestalii TaxID=193384 RepID=A0A8H2K5U7_9MICO|nr:alternate-type signal peptide domain-containing protein [Rhodoglobus vestalii]TQO20383.1 alternate signal-mediated exported protein [Rhodoglobus vestalii]
MNKLVKGSIAGAAGIALLLGGAGTLASWNASAAVEGGNISAGTLNIEAVDGEADGWQLNGTGAVEDNASDFTIVPGSALTYTATFDVTAIGDTLTATAALADESIVAASDSKEDVAFAKFLSSDATFTIDGKNETAVVASDVKQTVVVTVTINFANGEAGAENEAMRGDVNLKDFAITLTQTTN